MAKVFTGRPHRLVYLGTPHAAVAPLRALVEAGHDIALVVSNPDRKRGRGGALVPSPVKAAALDLGLDVSDRVDDVLDTGADLGVVVAYGRLIKPHVLDAIAMLNVHFSLLPRWRGAAPVERALLAGDTETGICLMALEEGLDTGPVYSRHTVAIGPDDTLDALRDRLVGLGAAMVVEALAQGLGEPEAQEGETTYASKLEPAEFEIDWTRPAEEVHRVVRLGRAWTTFRGRRLKVLGADWSSDGPRLDPGVIDGASVGSGRGSLELLVVQPEGKGPQPADAWRNGARPQPGERLGQ